jgi:hypothetical protein
VPSRLIAQWELPGIVATTVSRQAPNAFAASRFAAHFHTIRFEGGVIHLLDATGNRTELDCELIFAADETGAGHDPTIAADLLAPMAQRREGRARSVSVESDDPPDKPFVRQPGSLGKPPPGKSERRRGSERSHAPQLT